MSKYTISGEGLDLTNKEFQLPSSWQFAKDTPLQYDWDKYGAPKTKIKGDVQTWESPIIRDVFKKGKREGELKSTGTKEEVKWTSNDLGGTLKTKTTPYETTKKRSFVENFDPTDQWDKRGKFERLKKKGFGDLGNDKGYRKRLDPDTEPYRLHLPVTGELPEIATRFGSHIVKGMQLGSIHGGGFEEVIGEQASLGQRLLGVGRLNPNVDMSYLNSVGDANNIPGLAGAGLGFLTAGATMMGASGSEQSYLNIPFDNKFTRSKFMNTILPGFGDYAAKGSGGTGFDSITGTSSGGGTFSRDAKVFGSSYDNPNYSRQTQSKIHPLIPFTGKYTIGGDDKGDPDYSGNIFSDVGEFVYKGGLDRTLRKVGFPYGASFETPIPLLPPRMNIFDVNRFNVEKTEEEIYDPIQGALDKNTERFNKNSRTKWKNTRNLESYPSFQ